MTNQTSARYEAFLEVLSYLSEATYRYRPEEAPLVIIETIHFLAARIEAERPSVQ
ncbi:hypothetical protein HNP32_003411 [Brevundimonas bullata]|uniref:Uncharacterized protein n=1 Tax=Brevundimonas bullata TaxID=13160 RepID=A0A7W7N4N2_9CAUL|nr:hypothetical protein [Brevundimonas bullata]MBB4799653.1 hypothetical protein [Brevundimonas bullata]MBB6384276.1 hypothetical protein [Brevundimonas bullata]